MRRLAVLLIILYSLFVYSCSGNNNLNNNLSIYPKEKVEIYIPKNIEVMYQFTNIEHTKIRIIAEKNEVQIKILENQEIIYEGVGNVEEIRINKGIIEIKLKSIKDDNKIQILLY